MAINAKDIFLKNREYVSFKTLSETAVIRSM